MGRIDDNYFKTDKTMVNSIDDLLDKENDETILWRGKPKKSAYILNEFLKMFPIALIWILFDGFFISMFLVNADGFPSSMFISRFVTEIRRIGIESVFDFSSSKSIFSFNLCTTYHFIFKNASAFLLRDARHALA